MNTFKRVALIASGLVLIAFIISLLLIFFPVRHKNAEVPKGFSYGAPGQQIVAPKAGTYARYWYGFPITTKEVETVRYADEAYFDSSNYEVQSFNPIFALLNVLFWFSGLVTVLAPIAIFWHPKTKELLHKSSATPPGESKEPKT